MLTFLGKLWLHRQFWISGSDLNKFSVQFNWKFAQSSVNELHQEAQVKKFDNKLFD